MAAPITREQFKQNMLRRLGAPSIRVNVVDEQLEDRIDEALSIFFKKHYGGSEKVYIAHQMTAPEAASKTIVLDDTILGVVGVFDMGFTASYSGGSLLFNVPYQVLLSEIFPATGGGLASSSGLSSYVVTRIAMETLSEFINGRFPIRYNEYTDTLYLDCSPERLVAGQFVIIEAYAKNDPDLYPDVWADPWLQRYATALVKLQWGQNLGKFSGQKLPGDITVNGDVFKQEARAEIEELEQELESQFGPILSDFIG